MTDSAIQPDPASVPARAVPAVVMGVAGSGKSTLARRIAQVLGRTLVEGDDFHPPENVQKMRAGVPLTDADRIGWLDRLAVQLQTDPTGPVLSCSALKASYRDRLRAAAPGLCFVFLDVPQEAALDRVARRGGTHFFPPSVVASQFATLENPSGEAGVLRLDGLLPPDVLEARAIAWVRAAGANPQESLNR